MDTNDRHFVAVTGQNCAATVTGTRVNGMKEPAWAETHNTLPIPPHRPDWPVRWIAGDCYPRGLDQAAERRVRQHLRFREMIERSRNIARKPNDAPVP